ncbi:hypothetical protein B0A78_12295 [Flavobacterium columnare NBRC 100251 = ATCC 23463]|uniref:Uncharacterized protein n=1 Tax=Flavobacterium columnare (strain ATCC 49512 / CIP 103533 / TG 44/87) TaxID=1041826 RepID=G8X7E1_FLACA|nr:hypothetical protein [Flavobacterium columnare]AEW84955.1 hypothetical protein FCOL_00500 [Flavobacterium columnare ATCC 49512]ANO48229.1 hypothetical protein Pf1_02775 [Flavobacterium columnare]PDS22332.1 hypothetical protein B0A78_12295 [Flavobacterium columnare NBRC 100251 = ATCC 23463]GEM57456.1 hypothetical protein FC1_06940 [Flavobacterium columnare NBRC 100251 = ATCC 23463]
MMKINPKIGIDQLVFGMKPNDVVKLYGQPNKQFEDEEQNLIYLYNDQKWRLTFYEDEAFRLGYIISSNPDLILFEKTILAQPINEIQELLNAKKWKPLEIESFDSVDNYFNESNWMIFQVEYGSIIRFELGAVFNDHSDEFEWKFRG